MRLQMPDKIFTSSLHLLWVLLLVSGGAAAQGLPGQVPVESPSIDVLEYEIQAEIEPDRSFLKGAVRMRFRVLEETLAVPLTFNKQLSLLRVYDESDLQYSIRADDFSRDRIRVQGDDPLREGSEHVLVLEFEGLLEPEQYAFLDVPSTRKAVIGSDGAHLLSEGHWFPSHRLPMDSARVDLKITVPLGFTVVAPGRLVDIETLGIQEAFHWVSEAELTGAPVIVARFFRQTFEEGPFPITFYVTDTFDGDLAPYAEAMSGILSFYVEEFNDQPLDSLVVAQVSNVDLGSTGTRGLLLLEESILEAHTIPVPELAQRLASQWWGYTVRIDRPIDAWLADGFAAYASLRYFQEKEPNRFESRLSHHAVEALKYQDTAPIVSGLNLEIGSPKYGSIVSSKGAWVLYMLGQLIGAEELNGMIQDFYREYRDQAASIPDFVRLVNNRTPEDYGWFFVQWIESVGVPEFRLDYTIYKLREGGFRVRGQVKQNLELFRMPMEMRVQTKTSPEMKDLMVRGETTTFEFQTETMPTGFELDPNGKVLMDSEQMRIRVRVAIGDEYREAGEYVSALQEYERAIEMNPRISLAHFRLGQTFFEQHSYSNAANSMRDSLNGDLKPDWVETWAHIYLGKVYDILGQRQRAMAEYQKALNTQVDYNGAQAEARKYLEEPYTKPSSVLG